MKTIAGMMGSFLIPGLGQLFFGKVLWATAWFCSALWLGPWIAIPAVLHVPFCSEG